MTAQRQQTDTEQLFAAIRHWIDRHYPGVAGLHLGGMMPGDPQPIHIPIPPCRCNGEAHGGEAAASFAPTDFQLDLLGALEGKALRTDALAHACDVDRSRLFRKDGLKELQTEGWVQHHARHGFYRPDCPPPELA